MNIRLYSMAYPVTSLGPGNRCVLWVAGCGQRCKGCISPEMLSTRSGKEVPVDVLARRLLRLDPHTVEGITISGGEPFDQAEGLAALLAAVLDERPQWNVISYSGYTIDEIRRLGGARADYLARLDILIDGLYDRDVPQTHPLAGSGNQVVHYLTGRARELQPIIDATPIGRADYGIGAADFDMLIGVVQKTPRQAVLDLLRGARNK